MEIFNIKELASYLKCSISCIRSLIRKKEIPYFRIGNKLNFQKDSIDNWLMKQEQNNYENKDYDLKIKSFKEVHWNAQYKKGKTAHFAFKLYVLFPLPT